MITDTLILALLSYLPQTVNELLFYLIPNLQSHPVGIRHG